MASTLPFTSFTLLFRQNHPTNTATTKLSSFSQFKTLPHLSSRLSSSSFKVRSYKVVIEHEGQSTQLEVEPDESILSKALDSGLDVPHDCKLGVCVTCPAHLISGSVDQSDGMLSDDVVERGYALLCAAYPRKDSNKEGEKGVSVIHPETMALHAFHHFHSPPLTLSHTHRFRLSSPLLFKPQLQPLTSGAIGISLLPVKHRRFPVTGVVEESQESSEPESEPEPESEIVKSELATELKKAMQERKEKEADNFWSGVAQEISEIEWPAFGKVLGTTGVVLSVIFGSSVVLLTVNAVLAELSDRVFAGKGIQDFF